LKRDNISVTLGATSKLGRPTGNRNMTNYSKTSHTVFYHRFHLVWITKYRKRVLSGNLRLRIREIIAQIADEVGVKIVNGVMILSMPISMDTVKPIKPTI